MRRGLNLSLTAAIGQLAMHVPHVKQADIFSPPGWLASSFLKFESARSKLILSNQNPFPKKQLPYNYIITIM